MSPIVVTAGLMLLGYLVGSIPFSFLVARLHGVDLRTVGSGNIGGANVWRTCGFGAFIVAVIGDVVKGALPALAALYLVQLPEWGVILVGVAAILGHTFSIYLRFRGGKAVATSGGVLLAIVPVLIPIGIAAWLIAFLITRISSVASLTAAVVVLISATLVFVQGGLPLAYAAFVWVAVALIIYLHRTNIQRLIAGTENRFSRLH